MKTIQSELQNLLNDYLSKNPDNKQKLFNELLISLPTLKRWSEGKNLPHDAMAKPIIEYLKKLLKTG